MQNNMMMNMLIKFLTPVSYLWSAVYRARRFFYNYGIFKQNNFHIPIISIGNITFGGTGKTPFTHWLADYMEVRSKKVMILMRGYKGKLEHSSGILKSSRRLGYNPVEFGDEAMMLARRLNHASVVVGKNRSENLEHFFEQERPDIVLLDDGHQHLKLGRNLNIVLFDALMPVEKYKVAPKGYLREGLTALKDADLIVLGRVDQVSNDKIVALESLVKKYVNETVPTAHICYKANGLFNSTFQKILETNALKGKKAICVAGIASPLSFFNLIEELGIEILGKVSYPDHHFFSIEEVVELLEEAEKEDAYIITTEKDMVKMRRVHDSDRITYLEIQVEFLKGLEETENLISQVLEN